MLLFKNAGTAGPEFSSFGVAYANGARTAAGNRAFTVITEGCGSIVISPLQARRLRRELKAYLASRKRTTRKATRPKQVLGSAIGG